MKKSCHHRYLLTVDVGNTTTHFGLFFEGRLVGDFRLATQVARTADEYAAFVDYHLRRFNLDFSLVCHAFICSVVPPVEKPLKTMLEALLSVPAVFVTGASFPLPVLYEAKQEVGADRLVDALGAFECYKKKKKPLVVVDFGTATTFDVISKKGEYLGGAIAPGVEISLEALFQKTAKLPRLSVEKPGRVIGKNTIESLHSGLYYGFVSQVDGLIQRIEKELGESVFGLATGGLAPLIAPECKKIKIINLELTLYGLYVCHSLGSFSE